MPVADESRSSALRHRVATLPIPGRAPDQSMQRCGDILGVSAPKGHNDHSAPATTEDVESP